MKGIWPEQYMHNPDMNKPIEQIWDDIDGYSFEELYEQENKWGSLSFLVPFPPMNYKGKFVKGICFSQATRLLMERYPDMKKLFHVCANSMFASIPWSHNADMFFTCYKNEAREKYYKNKYPETKNIPFLPLQDADFLNEYTIAPVENKEKTIDVICVSTAFPVKNLPVIAKALKIYEEKYGRILKVVYAIGNNAAKKLDDGTLDYSGVIEYAKGPLREVDEILGDTKKYIDFIPYIKYYDLPKYYTAAKCGVLGSLIEGKNRFLSECRSCDCPVIVFKDFNKYTRGDYPVFFGNSGEYVPEFSSESLADTIHKVISHPENYEARKNYLKYNGRTNFVNIMVDSLPYYRENIPDYEPGKIHENLWVDLACYDNYQVGFRDFLYGKKIPLSHVVGIEDIKKLLSAYYTKFGLEWKD